jgi:hypothetical protein
MTEQRLTDFIRVDESNARIFVAKYRPSCLIDVPWSNSPFDCFLITGDNGNSRCHFQQVAIDVVSSCCVWVEVCGFASQELHDAIDQSSVSVGRQQRIGDGSPMTAWHDELTDLDSVAAWIAIDGLGSEAIKVALVLSDDINPGTLAEQITRRLTAAKEGQKAGFISQTE